MKLFFIINFFFFLNNCSFDNKTGIWKNEKINIKKKRNEFLKILKKFIY